MAVPSREIDRAELPESQWRLDAVERPGNEPLAVAPSGFFVLDPRRFNGSHGPMNDYGFCRLERLLNDFGKTARFHAGGGPTKGNDLLPPNGANHLAGGKFTLSICASIDTPPEEANKRVVIPLAQ